MKTVLIVCTANICRSPMAEGLLKTVISAKKPAKHWIVESAGTWGQAGLPAAENAVAVMKERGFNLSRHRSKIVDSAQMSRADLILTMEANHKEALRIEFPDQKDKIFLLSEMIGETFDIDDPMGQPREQFERTAREIEMILVEGFGRITELLGKPRHIR